MNRNTIGVIVAGSILAFAGVAQAADYDDYARVLSVSPQTEQVNQPTQECHTETVQVRSQERGAGGAIIGGVAGGIIGNQVGGGNGRAAATAIGAITGAIVGDRIENNDRPANVRQEQVQQCRNVDRWVTRNNGFAVTYEYHGRNYTSIMPYDPGERMRVHVSVTPRP